ncbi:rRNA maturation RNase YbeY [Candidatus Microgenomates bacterium]|nr:rRNA maturation RNase YbeY [Candidatus Microgenomates bacterium]
MKQALIKSESRYPVNRKKIRQKVKEIFKAKKITGETEVSIAVVGDRKMKTLNEKYRSKEGTTPVLSFSLDDHKKRQFPMTFSSPDHVLRLGDIVISFPQAVQMAADEEKLVDDKINELVEHGMGKLLGEEHR